MKENICSGYKRIAYIALVVWVFVAHGTKGRTKPVTEEIVSYFP